jgi:hypothetical protein
MMCSNATGYLLAGLAGGLLGWALSFIEDEPRQLYTGFIALAIFGILVKLQ